MRAVVIFILVTSLLGCKKSVKKEDLKWLNGYWEITEVAFPDGQKKSYSISTTIDYIELKGMTGFRKKVQPQLNGTYRTSDDAGQFSIFEKDGSFYFHYQNGVEQWEERLVALDQASLTTAIDNGNRYSYKRYEPISLKP